MATVGMGADRQTMPPAPKDLTPEARERWPGLVADLAALRDNETYEIDVALLADTLRAEARLAEVRAVLDREGVTALGSAGQVRPHGLLAAETALRRVVRGGWAALGLSPVDRHRQRVRDGRVRGRR
jgi:P27 family predicted phage terminase small subunit